MVRIKIEEKWMKKGKELHKIELEMKEKAIKLAKGAHLKRIAIGETPIEWYYFIIGISK